MSYRIAIYRETEKTLDGLDRTTARRIEAKIEELAQDPFSPACPDRWKPPRTNVIPGWVTGASSSG